MTGGKRRAPVAPDPAKDPFGALEHELRVLIRRAKSSATEIAELVHPQLEASAYPLLAHIAMRPGTRGSDLAAHFGVGRATVSRQLTRLEQLGLVSRTTDPGDTRGQLLGLTKDGKARLAAAREGRVSALRQALAAWERDDVVHLARLLRRYSADWVGWREAQGD